MKEYPATSKEFSVNDKTHTMQKLTLGLQSRIEDEDITVTYVEILKECTDLSDEDIAALHQDQLEAIYEDIALYSYTKAEEGAEPKKP